MTSIAFDTLDASATLRAAGSDEGVARAIVQVGVAASLYTVLK